MLHKSNENHFDSSTDPSSENNHEVKDKESTQDLETKLSQLEIGSTFKFKSSVKPIENYDVKRVFSDADTTAKKSHATWFAVKHKKSGQSHDAMNKRINTPWILKATITDEIKNYPKEDHPQLIALSYRIAKREVLGQELFRLVLPNHPKTQLVKDQNNAYYVASRMVQDTKDIPDLLVLKEKLENDEYQGLGAIAVLSLWLNEYDLKFGNVLLDKDDNFFKIDGGWLFTGLINSKLTSPITKKTVFYLPHHTDYLAYNWYFSRSEGLNREQMLIDWNYIKSPKNRREVSECLLQIACLPDHKIIEMIDHYIIEDGIANENNSKEAELIADFIIDRKRQLLSHALELEFFRNYLLTDDAEKMLDRFMEDLSCFTMTHHAALFIGDVFLVKEEFNELKCQLKGYSSVSKRQYEVLSQDEKSDFFAKIFNFSNCYFLINSLDKQNLASLKALSADIAAADEESILAEHKKVILDPVNALINKKILLQTSFVGLSDEDRGHYLLNFMQGHEGSIAQALYDKFKNEEIYSMYDELLHSPFKAIQENAEYLRYVFDLHFLKYTQSKIKDKDFEEKKGLFVEIPYVMVKLNNVLKGVEEIGLDFFEEALLINKNLIAEKMKLLENVLVNKKLSTNQMASEFCDDILKMYRQRNTVLNSKTANLNPTF